MAVSILNRRREYFKIIAFIGLNSLTNDYPVITICDVDYRARFIDGEDVIEKPGVTYWPGTRVRADVAMACFEIDNPSTFALFNDLVLEFRNSMPNTPILLVGLKSELRNENSQKYQLFPLAFGPILAQFFGAVKYIECSTNEIQGDCVALEEAVRASLLRINPGILARYFLNCRVLSSKLSEALEKIIKEITFDSTWTPVLMRTHINILFTNRSELSFDTESAPQNDLELLDEKFREMLSHSKTLSVSNIYLIQCLEFERMQLTYGPVGGNYIESINSEHSTMWFISDGTKENPWERICEQASDCETLEKLICDKDISRPGNLPVSLHFFRADCSSIIRLFQRIGPLPIRSVVIVNGSGILTFSFLSNLKSLENLVMANTRVDINTLLFPSIFNDTLLHLVMNNCDINMGGVPREIGKLKNLRVLNISGNRVTHLSTALSSLTKLDTLLLDRSNIVFPPAEVLNKSAKDIINYLDAIQENPVVNNEAKLIVVGQEGVGKSTLIKGMKRSYWFGKTDSPLKTDGVDVSSLSLKKIICKVYDLAGDVEYLNTHPLFLSPNCLHFVVFDLSQFVVSKETRSADQFGRLELWLQTIASQSPDTFVNIIATHADHPLIGTEIISSVRKLVLQCFKKYRATHLTKFSMDPFKECIICNPDRLPVDFLSVDSVEDNRLSDVSTCAVPHILGYFEVSSITKYPQTLIPRNYNLEFLKSSTESTLDGLMKIAQTDTIPAKWASFRKTVLRMLADDNSLKHQPILSFCDIRDFAFKSGIEREDKVISMLRFFHSLGEILWYEVLPEMKDVVILDPQWLSDQLCTLISHRSSVDVISDGILHLADLAVAWSDISEENRSKLLSLLRNAGLCFSISDTEELFPCNLPVGWPDREMWPPLPSSLENQTSLLFTFSFLPPLFFPDLIVAVHKKRDSFASNVQPLYYRFHIVYITKDRKKRATYEEQPTKNLTESSTDSINANVLHRIHFELMPYNNSLKVAIRGPFPCNIVPDIRTTVAYVQSCRYPGITYEEHLLCSECELKKVRNPAKFNIHQAHDGVCSKGHNIGSTDDLLSGKLSSVMIMPSLVGQAGRVMGETLQDHYCPKLFVVLPINLECLSLKDRFVYSYLRDGYAVHLLCECPEQWHFADSPGFRIGKPKEFFEKYGSRVCKVLRVISKLGAPFRIASALDPHCKIGSAVADGATSVADELQGLVESYLSKYPHLKDSFGSSKDDLKHLKASSGLQRSELARLLEVATKGRDFGPLVCTFVDKYNEWLWLCEEHNQRFETIENE